MSKIKVGDVFTNNQGCRAVVVQYKNYRDITIEFLDEHKYQKVVQKRYLDRGGFDNPYFKSVCGVGFLGVGDFKTSEKLTNEKGVVCYPHTKEYYIWSAMIRRCYSDDSLEKRPTYNNVNVCKEWHNFQNFAKWYKSQKKYGGDYHIDKDLISSDSKSYSPESACLIPSEINAVISIGYRHRVGSIGAYKTKKGRYQCFFGKNGESFNVGTFDTEQEAHQAYVIAKEAYVKEVANKWRGRIDERVYEALMAWSVNYE